jgi:ATP-dependent helicase/nuclease subunit A
MSALREADKQQRLAADPGASVFVTANAGSGKTKVLVDRIARLLLGGSRPSHFLCITYTKAAAAEMQRRLFERLGGWCIASDADLAKDLMKLGGEDAPQSSQKDLADARALFARALETPGGLKIQTIHGFCERLLARFPLEAGVAPGFDIADDARSADMLAQARAVCALKADDVEIQAFTRFAARMHGEGLETLLDRLAMKRGSLVKFASENGGAVGALQTLRTRHGVRNTLEELIAEILTLAPWPRLREAHTLLSGSSANDMKAAARIAMAREAFELGASRAAFDAYMSIALKADGEPYAKPVTKALGDKNPWLASLFADLVEQAVAARDGLNAIERADDARAALLLGLKLEGAYAKAKARAGLLDFDDLIAHAHALLSRAEAAPWVLYKLDGGLDHILIDEGQDTSPAQWDLTEPLQEEFFAGLGGRDTVRTVFAVGDPKQSIYAFQGADPERFLDEARKLSLRADRAAAIFKAPSLQTSFRSSPEVLRAVDEVFKSQPLARDPQGSDDILHLAWRENEPGLVEVWPIARRPEAQPARAWDAPMDSETGATAPILLARNIAKEVRCWIDAKEGVWEDGTLRAMHAGDVLILVRKRGALFHETIKALKREGLPVAGADRMVLKDDLAVEDCLALMRVALDPADDLSLACVLKGPWLNLTDDDADLFPLAADRKPRETLHARLMREDDEKYALARAFIAALIERAGADAFSFLSWALESLDAQGRSGWARVFSRLGVEARDPLEELLARALTPGSYAAPSLQRFVHEIEADAGQVKREMEGAGEAVRVMTVHGSKGLEARVVIVPDATSGPSAGGDDGFFMTPEGPYLSPRTAGDDEATRAARALADEASEGEHWRLFYVAMTRARDRLIVCGAQSGNALLGEHEKAWRPAAERALANIGEECDTPFGPGWRLGKKLYAEASPQAQKVQSSIPAWARVPIEALPRMRDAAPSRVKASDADVIVSPRGDGEARFKRGRLIHGLLQRLPDVAPERRAEAAENWLKRQGAEGKAARALAQEALAVISDPRCSIAFSTTSRAEAPIVGKAAGRTVRGVVDRLAVSDEEILLVDFKTDRPAPPCPEDAPEAYVLQMALYRAVLAQIFPDRAVRCALIWTDGPHLVDLPEAQLERTLKAYAQN